MGKVVPSEIPQENNYVYHVTGTRDVETLYHDGIDNTISYKDWSLLNSVLESVAEKENIQNRPTDRGNCSFAYPRYGDAVPKAEKTSSFAVVAIDLTKVSHKKYRASYHTATEVSSNLKSGGLGVGDVIQNRDSDSLAGETYRKAVEYWDSLEAITTDTVSKGGEILIDGPVPENAITHYTD